MFPTLSNKILFCYAGLGLAMKYETGDRREGKGRGDLQSSNIGRSQTETETETETGVSLVVMKSDVMRGSELQSIVCSL